MPFSRRPTKRSPGRRRSSPSSRRRRTVARVRSRSRAAWSSACMRKWRSGPWRSPAPSQRALELGRERPRWARGRRGGSEGMATEKGEDIPGRPPIPGDLPYREPPVIEGKAEEIHETRFEPTESAEASAGEPSPASMDEVKAAVENALDSNEPPAQPAREAREPEPMVREPSRSWPVWPLALAALMGLLPGLAALWLALQPRQDDTANAVAALRGDVTRLAARVDALEKRPDAGALRDTVAALDKRIASTETLARSAQATADKASSDAKAAATTAQSAADRPAATGSAPAAPAPDLSPLQQQIGDADTRIGALQPKIDQPTPGTRALTADKDTENAAAENPAALAVVAQSVQQALTRGTPYPTELSALKSLKADPTKIAALEP